MLLYHPLIISGYGAAGSALDWGSRGRRFKSCYSDQEKDDSKESSFSVLFALRRVILLRSDIVLRTVLFALRVYGE